MRVRVDLKSIYPVISVIIAPQCAPNHALASSTQRISKDCNIFRGVDNVTVVRQKLHHGRAQFRFFGRRRAFFTTFCGGGRGFSLPLFCASFHRECSLSVSVSAEWWSESGDYLLLHFHFGVFWLLAVLKRTSNTGSDGDVSSLVRHPVIGVVFVIVDVTRNDIVLFSLAVRACHVSCLVIWLKRNL